MFFLSHFWLWIPQMKAFFFFQIFTVTYILLLILWTFSHFLCPKHKSGWVLRTSKMTNANLWAFANFNLKTEVKMRTQFSFKLHFLLHEWLQYFCNLKRCRAFSFPSVNCPNLFIFLSCYCFLSWLWSTS